MNPIKKTNYNEYLQLDQLFQLQLTKSEENSALTELIRHEQFFIIIHQCYELWFKQIITELNTIITALTATGVKEIKLLEINNSFMRLHSIQALLNQHLPVLETLSPHDFMAFRDQLTPASGFQSWQFRLIEIALGVYDAVSIENCVFFQNLNSAKQQQLSQAKQQISLFSAIEKWLEQFSTEAMHFLNAYHKQVHQKLVKMRRETKDSIRLQQLNGLDQSFHRIFDANAYKKTSKRLARKHFISALFLCLNQFNDSYYTAAYNIIKNVVALDNLIAIWRYRHALMVQKMIGEKIGTGGTSGYNYLLESVEKNRVFNELAGLSGYLIANWED